MKQKTALIDADILLYEIGWVGQKKNPDGSTYYRDFNDVADILDNKIQAICAGAGAMAPPKLFLTGNKRYWGDDYLPNFREAIAVSKDYKGTRKQDKPFHYYNIYHYIISTYNTTISNGCEADDLICIEHYQQPDTTVVCTRDKDLRMCPGWHYGWECGLQGEFGPHYYSDLGEIELKRKYNKDGKCTSSKIVGGGFAFFASQLLTGDTVDNIGGLVKSGPVGAYELLSGAGSEDELLSIVKQSYREQVGEGWLETLQEQADLLWIARERNEDGTLKRYVIKEDDNG